MPPVQEGRGKTVNICWAPTLRPREVSIAAQDPAARSRGRQTHIQLDLVPNSLTELLFLQSSLEKALGEFSRLKPYPLKLKFQETRDPQALISWAAEAPGRHFPTRTRGGDALFTF